MFIRIAKSGGHEYLQVVEGYRNPQGKVRTKMIASLGRKDRLPPKKLDTLIKGLNRVAGRLENTADELLHDPARTYGTVFALHELWKALGFEQALKRALRSRRRRIDVAALVRAMVFNRLCDPASKLGCLRWLETVAMPDLPPAITHQHLLRAMDALIDNSEAIEDAIAEQIRPLVDREFTMVFYDLTTVRIHGEHETEDDIRAFGMNKETGGIARQFVLGVVQTANGLPLMHNVHSGNVAETKTLQAMLEKVQENFPIQRIVIVADRGLLSLDNVDHLTGMADKDGRKLEFILAVPARRYGDLVDVFQGFDFSTGEAIQEARFKGHRLIVAHDAHRASEPGEARRERIDALETLGNTMLAKLDAQEGGQNEGEHRASDRGAYSRFDRAIKDAKLSRFVKADKTAESFTWKVNDKAIARANLFDGKLVLLTNALDLTPAEAIASYKGLADIERGFRVLKSDLEIAPVHHRLADRIRAHALICFLALTLHRVMRMRLKAKGHKQSPQAALDVLSRIQKHTAYAGKRRFEGITKTTPEQLEIFNTLNLPKPT